MNASSTSFTTVNKVGLGLAALLGVADIVSLAMLTPDGENGPPLGIVIFGGLLGVVTLVAIGWALRTRSRGAIRIVAATRIVSAITALPAFFVDIPAGLRVFAGGIVILTVAVVVMILTPARGATPVID